MENVSTNIPIESANFTAYESDLALAKADILNGLRNFRLWHYIALTEIRRRYRRTIIGPFWTTLSIGIFILAMSIVLSALWNTSTKDFLPYFSSGYICWMLMSNLILEGCYTFVGNDHYLKQLSLPYIIYACMTAWRNLMVFAHHLVIFTLVLLYCGHPLNFNLLFIVPGLLIIFFTGIWLCLLLGMLCARYRDVQQIITSLLQLAMFVTPIMWKPEQLGPKGLLITKINPLYHYLSIVRLPLLGQMPTIENWLVTISLTCLLVLFTFSLFTKKYRTLIYWL